MIGPVGTIDKIAVSTMLDDLTPEEVTFIGQLIFKIKNRREPTANATIAFTEGEDEWHH